MEKMKAVLYDKKGSPEKLSLCEIDKPVAADNEVLIRVHAVSLNAADYRSMKMGIIPKKRIFGADVAGTIEAVGKGTSEFKPGDKVMGDLEFLAGLLQNGAIKPVIERRYTLDKAAEAMNYLSQGHSSGKVIINVNPIS